MNRLQEIEERLSAIKSELDTDGADLDALETEINSLKEERKQITEAAEKRKNLLDGITTGTIPAKIIKTEKTEERKMYSVESTEYRIAFMKKLQGKELDVEERAAITASGVIPTQTLNKIIEKLEQTSVLFRYIDVLHIPSNVSIPVEGTKNDASWVAMGTASTDSVDTYDTVSFAAYKLIKTIEITADVAAMAIDAFEAFVVNALVKKMSKAIENAILNGSGTSQPKGILKETFATTAKVTVGSTASVTYTDIFNLIGKLPSSYSQNAKFVVNRSFLYGTIAQVLGADNKAIFVPDAVEGFAGKIMGYPVIVDDLCPDNTLLLGDLSAYTMNFAQDITVNLDNSVGFRTGSTCYRAMALVDGKVTNLDAFVELVKS